jgi:6-phosphogluconate dehydrogenase
MIGLGRMGANMVMRLMRDGHNLVVYSDHQLEVRALEENGAKGAASLEDFVGGLLARRAIWLMLPAAAFDPVLTRLTSLLQPGDVVIDGGNRCGQKG